MTFRCSALSLRFQSTRPRGTRHSPEGQRDTLSRVSIHASARDATSTRGISRVRCAVSIHASARDATQTRRTARGARWFQSTRPRGTRLTCSALRSLRNVSIHASARDATICGVMQWAICGFQSTRPRGTRLGRCAPLVQACRFQSTRPRGTRPNLATMAAS